MDELTMEREAEIVRTVAAAMWPWYRVWWHPYDWSRASSHQRSRCLYAAFTAYAATKRELDHSR